MEYQISDGEFDLIIGTIRKQLVKTKLIKKLQVLKQLVLKLTEVRSMIVCPPD